MKRPPAGKRAFEAMGRSAYSRGLPLSHQRSMRIMWPNWARKAWAAGWLMQGPINVRGAA
jgi:hypothetical protein